jgi:hypothetical protein
LGVRQCLVEGHAQNVEAEFQFVRPDRQRRHELDDRVGPAAQLQDQTVVETVPLHRFRAVRPAGLDAQQHPPPAYAQRRVPAAAAPNAFVALRGVDNVTGATENQENEPAEADMLGADDARI